MNNKNQTMNNPQAASIRSYSPAYTGVTGRISTYSPTSNNNTLSLNSNIVVNNVQGNEAARIYRYKSPEPAVYNDYRLESHLSNNTNSYSHAPNNQYTNSYLNNNTNNGSYIGSNVYRGSNIQYLGDNQSGIVSTSMDAQPSISFRFTNTTDNFEYTSTNEKRLIGFNEGIQQQILSLKQNSTGMQQAKCNNSSDSYFGQLNNEGQPHGFGIYTFSNGYQYRGLFNNGRQHGKGILYKNILNKTNNSVNPYIDQTKVYEGQWKNGKKNGIGRYFYNSQNHYYVGPWENDQRHGSNGLYSGPFGRFFGQWANGRMSEGVFHSNKSNNKYSGRFTNNEFVQGQITYQNGDKYEGKVKNGLRHDERGRYKYNNMTGQVSQYNGNWVLDLKSQQGPPNLKLINQKGIRYSNGDILMGTFDSNRFKYGEPCIYKWFDGDMLNGWIKQGPSGYVITGHITKPDGKQYQVNK